MEDHRTGGTRVRIFFGLHNTFSSSLSPVMYRKELGKWKEMHSQSQEKCHVVNSGINEVSKWLKTGNLLGTMQAKPIINIAELGV